MLEEIYTSPHIILIKIDHQDRIVSLSPSAEAYLGKSLQLLKNKALKDVFPLKHPIFEIAQKNGSISVYNQMVAKDGSPWLCFDIHAFPSDDDGRLFFLYPRNLTEETDHSASARTATRLTSGMSAMLAHEIRNPLGAIRGAAQLLLEHASRDDHPFLEVIEEETARIGRLVAEFEDMASTSPAIKEAVNIHLVLDQIRRAALAGFAQNMTIVENYDPSLPDVAANADRLQAALNNIVKNAAEAISQQFSQDAKQGRITFFTRYSRGIKRQEHLPIEITISDNGGGIAEELFGDILKPFVTSKTNGTGLGLSMVAQTVEAFGGIIEVKNINNGCAIIMRLPIWKA